MAIGDPKIKKTMKEELAALKKKREAGKLTAFKYRQGVTKIKEKYGKAPPSTASKVMKYITTKGPMDAVRDFAPKLLEISPQSAKAVAAKKAAGLANRGKSQGGRTAAEDKKARPATKKDNFLAGLNLNKEKKEKRAAPKFNPSGLKVPAKKKAKAAAKKEKLYDTINPKTGKLTNKKVSAKQHLKNIDMNKARIRKEAQENIDRTLKIATNKSMKKKKRG